MPDTKTRNQDRTAVEDQWTDAEIAAMKEHAKEIKRAQQRKKGKDKGDGLRDLMEKIAELPESDRVMAKGVHETVMKAAPELEPRTYYGMPAWARDGKVLCWFTPAAKFKERYASFAFSADANLDDGSMWATSWALPKLTKADEKRIAELVKKAVS
jgi:uncharacterized protein YdhG (YjbR/CyaY superfamily)